MNRYRANRIQEYSWFTLLVSLLFLYVGSYIFGFNKLVFTIAFFLSAVGAIISFFIYVTIYTYRRKKGYTMEKYI
ncbi:hypothetical protein [[Eubacterium] cellulosolvens]